MKKSLYIILGIAILLMCGCKKEPDPVWTVQYKVINQGYERPTYRLTYMLQSGGTKVVGPITTWHWESEILPDFEGERPVQLEMEITSGEGEYELQILRDGAVHHSEILPLGQKTLFIESIL